MTTSTPAVAAGSATVPGGSSTGTGSGSGSPGASGGGGNNNYNYNYNGGSLYDWTNGNILSSSSSKTTS